MRSQHLLLTLLGDYWLDRSEPLPSAALVALLGEFAVTPAGARAALSRLSRRGLLETSRSGRHTSYRLSKKAEGMLRSGVGQVRAFTTPSEPWNGNWTCVAFSVPNERAGLRPVLRSRLRWLGAAPLLDGLWCSPGERSGELVACLDDLGIEASCVLVGRFVERQGGLRPLDAWDLDQIRSAYDEFVGRFAPLANQVRIGPASGAGGLVARTEVADSWRRMPGIDPGLPEQLLPADWPRSAAREVFVTVYDGLGPAAEVEVRRIIALYDAGLSELVAHHGNPAPR